MMTAAVASIVLPPVAFLVAAVVLLLVLVVSLVVLRRRGAAGEVPATEDLAGEDLTGEDLTHQDPSDDDLTHQDPSDDLPVETTVDEERPDEARSPEAAAVAVEEPVVVAGDDPARVPGAGPHDGPHHDELSSDDPRALRLLVRTLEAALEELTTDRDRPSGAGAAPPPTPGVSAPAEPVAASRPSEVAAERHVRAISEALKGSGGGDLAARLNAALVRRGVPRTFARPTLAACIGEDLPVVRPEAGVPAPGGSASVPGTPDGPTQDAGRPEDAGLASQDDQPTPDDGVPVPEQSDAPAEPERVLPVPAPPAPAPATRRGLFRRPVA